METIGPYELWIIPYYKKNLPLYTKVTLQIWKTFKYDSISKM